MKHAERRMPCPRCGAKDAAIVSARYLSAEENPMADEGAVTVWLHLQKKPPFDTNDEGRHSCYSCGLCGSLIIPRIVVAPGSEDEAMQLAIEKLWKEAAETLCPVAATKHTAEAL